MDRQPHAGAVPLARLPGRGSLTPAQRGTMGGGLRPAPCIWTLFLRASSDRDALITKIYGQIIF